MDHIATKWVLCIPDKQQQRTMCFPVEYKPATNTTAPLPIFASFQTRPVVPIFHSKREGLRFRDEVVCRYHSHMTEWEMYYSANDNGVLPDLCRMVYVENTLRNRSKPKNDTFQSHPVPFDFSNKDLIVSMSLQSNTGFFMVDSFDVSKQILSMNGVLVESSYENVSGDEHVKYLCDKLNY
jgi:hypothetical protein